MNRLKQIIRAVLALAVGAGLIAAFAFMQEQENKLLCGQMKISIFRKPGVEIFFVEEEHIREMIAMRIGQLEKVPVKNINVHLLEKILYENPWVQKADAYLGIDGTLFIEIEQKNPILRIMNSRGESFYLDENGMSMPWAKHFTPRVLVASGNIPENYASCKNFCAKEVINNDTLKTQSSLVDLFALTKFILADGFWSAQMEQLFVNVDGDIELVPKVGNHIIIFGDRSNMENKFRKLKFFYKEGLNYTGWNQYDTLNLKFKNQVVATKKSN